MSRATSSEKNTAKATDQAELLEVLPGDAAHEAHGHEHGDDGQR